MIEPATALAFSLYENKGVYALLLGSGVSRASQIPTGWEIILDLARKVGALEEAGEQANWAAWYRTRFEKEPNYSDLLDMLSHDLTGILDRADWEATAWPLPWVAGRPDPGS